MIEGAYAIFHEKSGALEILACAVWRYLVDRGDDYNASGCGDLTRSIPLPFI